MELYEDQVYRRPVTTTRGQTYQYLQVERLYPNTAVIADWDPHAHEPLPIPLIVTRQSLQQRLIRDNYTLWRP